MQSVAVSSLLIASALAVFPPTALSECDAAGLAARGEAQAACFQRVADAQAAADEARLAKQAQKDVAAAEAAALRFVQGNGAGLQAGLHAGRAATAAWCEGEFNIAQFVKLVGVDECKKICSQFQNNVIDASASAKAFECLVPLATKAVDDAANAADRAAAVDGKQKAALLFVSTQFQDRTNSVVVSNGKGDGITAFSDKTKDLVFNNGEITDLTVGQEKAADLNAARAVDANANAPALDKAFVSFFIPNLEVKADVAAARTDLRAAAPFGAAADQLFKATGADVAVATPGNIVFTNLGLADNNADVTAFVGLETAVVAAGNKRAPAPAQVGAFGQNLNEIITNKLALTTLCTVKGLACTSSRVGGVSKQEFVETQVETQAEKKIRIEKEQKEQAAKDAAAKAEADKKKPVNNNNNNNGYPAGNPHAAPADTGSASAVFMALGAVVAAVAAFL